MTLLAVTGMTVPARAALVLRRPEYRCKMLLTSVYSDHSSQQRTLWHDSCRWSHHGRRSGSQHGTAGLGWHFLGEPAAFESKSRLCPTDCHISQSMDPPAATPGMGASLTIGGGGAFIISGGALSGAVAT